jgi:hypothetical protein
MSEELVAIYFLLANVLVLPPYFAMAFAPHTRWTRAYINSLWSVTPPVLLHVSLAFVLVGLQPDVLNYYGPMFKDALNLAKIPAFLEMISMPQFMMVSWVHMVAADLVMARWAFLDSREREMNAWFVSPTILVIMVAGPLGFALYMLVRWLHALLPPKAL